MIDELITISPLDGRYWQKIKIISDYFSEGAIFKYRLVIEVNYLIALVERTRIARRMTSRQKNQLRKIIINFDQKEAKKIKKIEEEVNHDVKAVEYYLKRELKKKKLESYSEIVHFGLTSDDINNLAYGLALKEILEKVYLPSLKKVIASLKVLAKVNKDKTMLALTHGQPAVPTTMGKEIAVFAKRLADEEKILSQLEIHGKISGSVGNFNAHIVAYPEINWLSFSEKFVRSLDLRPDLATTQIQPYDSWVRVFDTIKRINTILIGFSQDCWHYISKEYFLQKVVKKEVGSSTMPHKVNPINFETAEGILGVANALLRFFGDKLLISRFQRDLSDSSVRRVVGEAFGYSLLGYQNILMGLSRIKVNPPKMKQELGENWEIIAEAIQTVLRSVGYPRPYEILKEETRGKRINKEKIVNLIENLQVKDEVKDRLKKITPFSYLGLAEKLTDNILKEV